MPLTRSCAAGSFIFSKNRAKLRGRVASASTVSSAMLYTNCRPEWYGREYDSSCSRVTDYRRTLFNPGEMIADFCLLANGHDWLCPALVMLSSDGQTLPSQSLKRSKLNLHIEPLIIYLSQPRTQSLCLCRASRGTEVQRSSIADT